MGITANIDISAEQRQLILALINKHLPNTQIWAFGSRVKWTTRSNSDLDLVAFSTPQQDLQISALKEAFDESNLPFRVDLLVWDNLPENFQRNIQERYEVLVEANDVGRGLVRRSNWSLKKISDVADFFNNKRVPLSSLERQKRQGKYPYYGASGIVDSIDDYIFDGTYLLISEDGENLRTRNTPIAFKASGKFWVNNHAHILAEKEEGILDYLEYYFSNLDLTPYITGAVQPKLNKANLDSIEIPVPDKNERLAINEILNSITNKIELNRQTNQTLEQIAQAIFKSWFVDFEPVKAKMAAEQAGATVEQIEQAAICAISGKTPQQLAQLDPQTLQQLKTTAALFPDALVESELGEIPEGWEVKTIDDVTSLIIDHRGKTPNKLGGDWSESGHPVLSAKIIKAGRIVNHQSIRYVSDEMYSLWMKDELEIGDVLITSEAPMGEMYFLTEDIKYCLSQRLFALRANNRDVTPSYLYLWLQSATAQADLIGRATGTTVVGVRQSELRKVNVLVPSPEILQSIEEKIFSIYKKLNINEREAQELSEIRDLLLPRLLSGQLLEEL